LLVHGRWFSPGTPASSTTKTSRNDIAEILLKVALNTKHQSINLLFWLVIPSHNLHVTQEVYVLHQEDFFPIL
jgi:hypothetical protein